MCFIINPALFGTIKPKKLHWDGHVIRMEATKNVYKVSVGKPLRKRPHGTPRCGWVTNIMTFFRTQIVRMG